MCDDGREMLLHDLTERNGPHLGLPYLVIVVLEDFALDGVCPGVEFRHFSDPELLSLDAVRG